MMALAARRAVARVRSAAPTAPAPRRLRWRRGLAAAAAAGAAKRPVRRGAAGGLGADGDDFGGASAAELEAQAAAEEEAALRYVETADILRGDNAVVKSADFVQSSVSWDRCPPEPYPEFAFIGRSNVGKSSLVNMLTSRKKLAMTSKTPGKTQTINHFRLRSADGPWFLVDLPGYGYAKAPRKVADEWIKFTQQYFLNRPNLVRVFVLVDSTIKPREVDVECIGWLGDHSVPVSVVFTKSDRRKKVKAGQRTDHYENVRLFQERLRQDWDELPPCIVCSSVTRDGKEELLGHIAFCRKLAKKGFSRKE